MLESNHEALKLGHDFAKQNFECPLPFRLQRMDANGDKILIDGNTATALGALYAGCTVAAPVSDHARDLGDGVIQEPLRALPQGSSNREEQLRDYSGRRRARGHRDRSSARVGPAPVPSRPRPGPGFP